MAVGLDIRVDANTVLHRLPLIGRAVTFVTKRVIKRRLQAAINRTKAYTSAPRPSYQRTGVYGRSFSLVESPFGGGIGFTAKTEAIDHRGKLYSPFVTGNAEGIGQAWMHVGRWLIFRKEVDREVPNAAIRDIDSEMQSEINSLGMG